VSDIADLK